MAKKKKVHKDLNSEVPFAHNGERVFGGSKKTSLKHKKNRFGSVVAGELVSGNVKGTLKAKGKGRSAHKRTVTKA